jgi:hypothetical protein
VLTLAQDAQDRSSDRKPANHIRPPPAHPFPISTMSKSRPNLCPNSPEILPKQSLPRPRRRAAQHAAPQREAPYTTLPPKPSTTYLQKNDGAVTAPSHSPGTPGFAAY